MSASSAAGILVVIVFTRASRRSLAGQVLIVQVVLAVLVVGLSAAMAYREADRRVEELTRARVLDIATAIAATDDVREGLAAADPAAALEQLAERERRRTGTDFVVIMTPDGVRHTHPTAALVGGRYVGTIAPAAAGGVVVEDYTGSLGPSTRAAVPVLVEERVVGLVAVGVRRARVDDAMLALLPDILVWVGVVALLSGLGTWYVAQRVRRQTLGLKADELARMAAHHDAVLHAVREGLVIVGRDGAVQLVNDEARRLLGLDADAVGRPVRDLALAPSLVAMLTSRGRHADSLHAGAGRILLVSSAEVRRGERFIATLTTLRDRTELEALTGELGTVKGLADALHAQAHEAANRLHTVITLAELGRVEEAVRFGTAELRSRQRSRDLILAALEEPAVAALVLGKASQAAERGITLEVDPEAHLPAGALPPHETVTILGNLIDNAIDSLAGSAQPGARVEGEPAHGQGPTTGEAAGERTIMVDAQVDGEQVILTVADTGPGLTEEVAREAFTRGWSTKAADGPAGRGLGLALVQQTAAGLGGSVQVSRPPGAAFTVRLPRYDTAGQVP